ncbi:ABC transporter permease [Gorillibacterium sp. sgz5001074]|uniref:ABC transporter permease n=1 Tax=Gorillibacterium sp. sgz5001074 TaxID=3446695 RepID=UPI003F6777D1
MLHLIRLELRRFKIRGPVRTLAIATLAILGFVLLVGYSEVAEGTKPFRDYAEALDVIELFAKSTFVIYASVLLSRLVIDEYRNRTMTILFMYPVNRKKLLFSKLLIVGVVTFLCILVSDVLASVGFYFFNERWSIVQDPLTAEVMANQALSLVVNAAASAGMALIPLFFGMRKKSVPTTIVSSILIIGILNTGDNNANLGTIIGIPITLGFIGLLVAYLSIRKVEHVDL